MKSMSRMALLLVLLSTHAALAAGAGVADNSISTVYRYAVEPIATGVHLFTQGNAFHLQPRGNVGVIEQADGFVLVDSGGSPAGAEEVIAFLGKQSRKPVTAIILTHWHGDHALGVSRLIEQWPRARVIATQATGELLRSPNADRFMPGDDAKANAAYRENLKANLEFLRSAATDAARSDADRAGFATAATEFAQFAHEMERARRVAPTETFTSRIDLDDAKVPVEVHFYGRANTSGDAVVWLPKQRVVFTGDVVVAPIPYGFNVYPSDWIGVLGKITALAPAVIVPGHGQAMRDSSYVERLRGMLRSVRAQVAALAADKNISVENVGKKIQLEQDMEALTHDDPWLQRWFRAYWVGPLGSSALREARGEEIVQGAG